VAALRSAAGGCLRHGGAARARALTGAAPRPQDGEPPRDGGVGVQGGGLRAGAGPRRRQRQGGEPAARQHREPWARHGADVRRVPLLATH
jgi:hypothetical protein